MQEETQPSNNINGMPNHAADASYNAVEPQIYPPAYGMPGGLKIKIVLWGIGLSLLSFLVGILFTVFMITTPFDSGPLNAIQRPILAMSKIPADAHRQWLDFNETLSLVNRYFYDRDKINQKEMLYEASKAAVTYLGDPYSQFVPPERSTEIRQSLSGARVGIGITAQYNSQDKNISIKEVVEDAPADKAGVKAGDIVQKINGQLVAITGDANADLTQLSTQLKGERNTKVTVTLQRPAEDNRVLDVEITRNDFVVPSVKTKMLPGKIGYAQVTVFGDNTVSEFDQKVKKLSDDGAVGLILDLRNNGGGFAKTAEDLLARFFKDGVAYYTDIPADNIKFRENPIPENKNGLKLYDLPVVVLVNEGSASASEITAGALQGRGRAALIGQKTYGKGVAQTVQTLYDGSTARITFEKWYTPQKIDITKQGLKPDVVIPQTQDDVNAGRDPQLDRATKFLLDKERV